MTKLTEDIRKAITAVPSHYDNIATAAAEVCKGYIERAFDAGYNKSAAENQGILSAMYPELNELPSKEEFLKSEGITE